jgi:hypothetical protein
MLRQPCQLRTRRHHDLLNRPTLPRILRKRESQYLAKAADRDLAGPIDEQKQIKCCSWQAVDKSDAEAVLAAFLVKGSRRPDANPGPEEVYTAFAAFDAISGYRWPRDPRPLNQSNIFLGGSSRSPGSGPASLLHPHIFPH